MSNPFADQHSLSSNPFDDSSKYLEPDEEPTPQQSTHNLPYKGNADTQNRLEDLRKREAELEARESALKRREEQVRRGVSNNFPPFWPLIYHDIPAEIPAESQTTVTTLFRIWLLLPVVLTFNLVACVFMLVAGMEDGAKDMGAAILYFPVIPPMAFLLWYRPIYNAYMKEHALYYYMYFLFGGFHIAFCIYLTVGIPSTGGAGLINMIHAFSTGHWLTGAFALVATIGWVLESASSLWMYRMIWSHHNDKGHTFQQAKEELGTHGMKAYFSRSSNV